MAKSKPQKRYRKHVTFTLSDEARGTLEELSEDLGISKSAVVELVIRGKAAELGMGLGDRAPEARREGRFPRVAVTQTGRGECGGRTAQPQVTIVRMWCILVRPTIHNKRPRLWSPGGYKCV